MTQRERMLATLDHRQPDRIPYSIGFTQRAHEAMIAYTGNPRFAETLEQAFVGTGCGPVNTWHEVAPEIWEDPFGVQWDKSKDKDIGVVCNQMITPETLEAYQFPPLMEHRALQQARTSPDEFVVANLGFSLFERAWTLAGFENVLAAMVDDPDYLHRLLDRILEYNLSVIDAACTQDVDAMMFGDDWGQQNGLIMGPALWREFIKPRIAQMYARVHRYGKYVFIHSCGKVDGVFPDLIEIGLNVFNPFQPEVIDVVEAKRRYGDALTFFGGISTQRTLPYGTAQETKDETRRLLEVVGKDGGLIAAPAHAIPGDAKPENILAMIDVLEHQ